MVELRIGPLLRYTDAESAVIWAELDEACTVTVHAGQQQGSARTFTVHGHHYALVDIDGLAPGSTTDYSVTVDGRQLWPQADPETHLPPSRIRTHAPGRPWQLAYGSCRVSVGHGPQDNQAYGQDALRAYGQRLAHPTHDADGGEPEQAWPSLLLFLGDQVYADETSPQMREFIAARRSLDEPPGEELRDYAEYAHLYRLAWAEPMNRWLLSTVPTAMIFDDHDVRDDWNTSYTWRQQMAALPWWHRRIVSALASYWVYQHLGNLSAAQRAEDDWWRQVSALPDGADAGELLDDLAERANDDPDFYRWSYTRDIGDARLVVIDSRAARALRPGRRSMLDDAQMAWFREQLRGDVDHVLIGTSLPFLLPPGLHQLEAWDEAVAEGAWGRWPARVGERIRQGVDLEHWAAFQHAFRDVAEQLAKVARGERGSAPASIVLLSGDVHHSYLAQADPGGGRVSHLLQGVCSPIRNPMPTKAKWGIRVAVHRRAGRLLRGLARGAKVADPPWSWSVREGPWFENNLATVDVDGRSLRMRWLAADEGPQPRVITDVTFKADLR